MGMKFVEMNIRRKKLDCRWTFQELDALQSLYVDGNRFGNVGVEDMLCPLSRFSALQLQANITLKTIVFGGSNTKMGRDGLTTVFEDGDNKRDGCTSPDSRRCESRT
ncbi:unnamed protein product [Microthlaspi erraticum]|uniref:Uncharacterized protein n=1 Tax=Microthlaspi erraticum TaxID=1685480 RepID=A0A6D2JKU6_9BRAS|nr:unnamed protein product [Microthlaspi erraticum]